MNETDKELMSIRDMVYEDVNDDGIISVKERIGKENIDRILHKNDELGGVYSEATGSQGSAKTSINLAFLKYYIENYPRDKCFWSSTYNAPLQFLKMGDGDWQIMVLKGSKVEFRDREANGALLDLPVTYFETFDELYKKAKPGKCNAVFFGDRLIWMDFLHYLRSIYDWVHVFFDEFGEVCPSDQSDVLWRKIRTFAEDIKEIRKCNMNVHTNTQSTTDIDYRVRRKLMIRIFLPGAKSDGKTRVYQKAIDNLRKDRAHGNMAYLDYDGSFGITRFRNIFKPLQHRSWEARIKTEDDGHGKIQTRADDASRHT